MNVLKTILLVEDNPNDVELTLEALAEYRLANEIVVVNDGAEALDYLYRRGRFATRAPTRRRSSSWTSRCPRWTASRS